MCDHPNRESAMVITHRDADGRASVWCDPCLVPLVKALNQGGLGTVASCCGHGHSPGRISLADSRMLLVLPDREWDDLLADLIHTMVGCYPGRECTACAAADAGGQL